MKLRPSVGIGGVLCVVLLVPSDTASPRARAADPSWVTYTGPLSLEREADEEPASTMSIQSANELVERHSDHLLGYYVKDGAVVVAAGDATGAELASRELGDEPDVIIRTVEVTLDETVDLGVEMRDLSDTLDENIFLSAPAPEIGGMLVAVATEPSKKDRALIETFAATHRVPVRVEVFGDPLTFTPADR